MILNKQNNSHRGINILLSTAAIIIIMAGIYLAQSIVVLLMVSIFLASLGAQPLLWLKSKHIPTGIAVLIVMSFMIIILLLIGIQIGSSISNFLTELPLLQSRIREQVIKFSSLISSKEFIINEKIILEYINPEAVMKLTASLLSGLGSVLSDIVLIILTVTFILLEVTSFPIKLRSLLGQPEQKFPQFTKFIDDLKRYMIIKTLISLVTGILITVWLYILGVDYAILWGFLAFLLNFIPNIGSMVAAFPTLILSMFQLGIGNAILVAAGYMVINFTIGNILEPRLMGRKLGLSTLVVFLSLIFWGGLLGIVGAILSIPLTMTVKFAFENNENTRWIAVLLESEKILKTSN
ncbi:MAG: AI-2E family transporter [Melioribacteraceae bacterium]